MRVIDCSPRLSAAIRVPIEIPYLLPGSQQVRRGNATALAGRWGEAESIGRRCWDAIRLTFRRFTIWLSPRPRVKIFRERRNWRVERSGFTLRGSIKKRWFGLNHVKEMITTRSGCQIHRRDGL